MQLSRENLLNISSDLVEIPGPGLFSLPEKVLQFGTGVLLRGLPDFYIDRANKKGWFNGRVVMVKSTASGDTDLFEKQDYLYTQCLKGISQGSLKEQYIINAAVSRIISARTHWRHVLALAASPDLQVIISNTTEAGIVYDENDDIDADPPGTFPHKLYSFLKERYIIFKGDYSRGLVILPTELLVNNADVLKSILLQIADHTQAETDFREWLTGANHFCNTLVDRIVPGKLPENIQTETEEKLGYTDPLMMMSEPYSLWAIETSHPVVKEKLSFAQMDPSVIICPDINKFRELKLRLLNGTHSFSCALAYLSGFDTVKQAMENASFKNFVTGLMKNEIIPCITGKEISIEDAKDFAEKVADRFSNPFLDHRWLSISVHYTQKMKQRNLPLLAEAANRSLPVPKFMAMGFAAYLLFMKCTPGEDGKYYGNRKSENYLIQDEAGVYFSAWWKEDDAAKVVNTCFSDSQFWGGEVYTPDGFPTEVLIYLNDFMHNGIKL